MTNFATYPCNRGTRIPLGWHKYVGTLGGNVVCEYCGKILQPEAKA